MDSVRHETRMRAKLLSQLLSPRFALLEVLEELVEYVCEGSADASVFGFGQFIDLGADFGAGFSFHLVPNCTISRLKRYRWPLRRNSTTETRGKMASNSDRSRRELSHFHACVHCGNVSRRDEFDGTAVATGIYPCSKCGQDGPLNIVIRDVEATTTGTSDSAPGRLAG